MSFRFWRRVQLFPGVSVSLNLSKSRRLALRGTARR